MTKKRLDVECYLKFEINLGADICFTLTEFGGGRLREHNFGGQKSAKSGRFEPAYLGRN